jgi:hypothetical protein
MNTLRLVLFLLVVLPLAASARLGETRKQSEALYGAPFKTEGNVALYKDGDWRVVQWFDPATELAEVIWYVKYNGGITREEANKIMRGNLPAYLCQGDQWEPQVGFVNEHGEAHYKSWLSKDGHYRYQSGLAQKKAYIMISTSRGAKDSMKDPHAVRPPL